MLRFTQNLINDVADEISSSEYITSISLQTYTGTFDRRCVRIVNDSLTQTETIVIYSASPFLSFSFDKTYGYSKLKECTVLPNSISECLFVEMNPALDFPDTPIGATMIYFNDTPLTVNYSISSSFDSETTSLADRYLNTEQINVTEQFSINGTNVKITEWQPAAKPLGSMPTNAHLPIRIFESLWSVSEMTNRFNSLVGYRKTNEYHVKAFIGAPEIETMFQHGYQGDTSDYKQTSKILLPANFVGFQFTPNPRRVVFNMFGPTTLAFQHTVYLLEYNGIELHLTNVQKQFYMNGVFIYFSCDLFAVQSPGGANVNGYSPFHLLYDVDGKEIAALKSYNTIAKSDPYFEYDPYFEDPYCSDPRTLEGETMAVYDPQTDKVIITDWKAF